MEERKIKKVVREYIERIFTSLEILQGASNDEYIDCPECGRFRAIEHQGKGFWRCVWERLFICFSAGFKAAKTIGSKNALAANAKSRKYSKIFKDDIKKDFGDYLKLINDENIRISIQNVLKSAPKEFWTEPCSSSGKFHPPEDNFNGGIIIHSRKAVQAAISLCRFFEIKSSLIKDKIIAACILHDLQKGGIPWSKGTHPCHGELAAIWLKGIINDKDILDLIQNHMGAWNKPKSTPALKIGETLTEKNIMHLIVQLADYWASRKFCSFIINEIIEC